MASIRERARPLRGLSPPRPLAALSLAVGILYALPLLYLVIRNVTERSDVVAEVRANALEPLGRTLWLAATVSVSTSVVAVVLAWVLHRTDVPGRGLLRVLAPLPLVFPSFVGAAALLSAVGPGGMIEDVAGVTAVPRIEGYWAALATLTLFTYPLVYLPVAARIATLSPSLEESGRMLGASSASVFRAVVWPQIRPAVRAGALLVFLYTLSDFGVVAQVRYDTLTRAIYESRLFAPARSFALALVLGLVAVAVVAAERAAVRRVPPPAVGRVRPATTVRLGRLRWPVAGFAGAFMAAALGGPLASLAWWAWRGISNTADPGGELSGQLSDLVAPTVNTALLGVGGAIVAVALVLPVAWLTTRYRSGVGAVANSLIVGGYALPGISIALAGVFWSLNTAEVLYQSVPLLVAAYVLHFGAQSMRSSQVAVAGVPTRVSEAAQMLGASRVRRFSTVEVRVMWPGLLAGGGLVLLSVMKELPATLLLHPTSVDTLTTRIWPAIEGHFLARAGLGSLVLVLLSASLTWLLVLRRGDLVA